MWAYAMPMCVVFVSSTFGIVFNPCIDRQSAKDIGPYFKFQLHVEDPGHRKPALIFIERAE